MDQSLIRILDNPVVAPAKCVVCGSAGNADRKFIDFGFSFDWYGAVYFCTICFTEIAEKCNFIESKTYETLLERNQELKGALDKADRRIESLNDTLRHCFNGNSLVDTLRDVSDSDEISQAPARGIEDTVGSTPDSNESSNIEESGDIFSSTEFDVPATVTIDASNPLQF